MKRTDALWYLFVRDFIRFVIFPIFIGRVTVEGAEKVPNTGPVIIAPIHLSYLDPPLVGGTSRRAVSYMAKKELFDNRLMGLFIRSLNSFPVDRGSGDMEAIRLAIDILQRGEALLMFPEGTRGDGVTMGRIGYGTGMIAKKTGAKVVPVGISGTEKAWPKGAKPIKRSPLKIVYGDPISYTDLIEELGEKEAKAQYPARLQAALLEVTAKAGLNLKTGS